MDKAQKQLIDSYYRARSIAVKQSERYNWENYEVSNVDKYFKYEKILEYDLFVDSMKRANFFNKLFNTNKFKKIMSFTIGNNKIAIAVLNNTKTVFINKKGEESIEDITEEDINKFDSNKFEIYFNQLSGYNKFFKINMFKFAYKTIASAHINDYVNDLDTVFINKKGEESIEGITEEDIIHVMDRDEKTAYYNQKNGSNKYFNVYGFVYGYKEISPVIFLNKEIGFINIRGESSIEGITYKDIKSMDYMLRAVYYNQLLGVKNFKSIFDFIYNDGEFAWAELVNGVGIYINTDGKQVDYKEE